MSQERHNDDDLEELSPDRRKLIGREAADLFDKWWEGAGIRISGPLDHLARLGLNYMATRPSEEAYFRGCLANNLRDGLKERWEQVRAQRARDDQAPEVTHEAPTSNSSLAD